MINNLIFTYLIFINIFFEDQPGKQKKKKKHNTYI